MLKVLEAGIEPALPKELDFESSASTNSATRACGRQKYKKIVLEKWIPSNFLFNGS